MQWLESCLVQEPYLVKFTSCNPKVPVATGTLSVCICIYNNIRYSLTKRVSFSRYSSPQPKNVVKGNFLPAQLMRPGIG